MSYVWGNAKHLTLRTDTFRRLTSPNGLSDELEDIPRSFQDAMRLVGCLGLEYLWIDALCIKQDDADDVDSHLRAMDSIYSCAALTIVAATDSVDTGLPGMHLFSRLKSQNVYRSGRHYADKRKAHFFRGAKKVCLGEQSGQCRKSTSRRGF
jgi:hypothetical protein